MNALELISAINTLLQLAGNAGISWSRLRAAIDKAKAEGREFSVEDLQAIADDTDKALQRLRDAIAHASPKS